jgi:hypothetical protein
MMKQTTSNFTPHGRAIVRCIRPDGSIRWTEEAPNLVTNAGLNFLLDNGLNSTEAGTLYIGLKNIGSPAAGDTMGSHAGWTENENYSEANRPAWGQGSASSQQVTNASPADFSIDTDSQTIAGLFITTDNTIGGTSGTLISAVNFGSSKATGDGDTLQVTYTLSAGDDGS